MDNSPTQIVLSVGASTLVTNGDVVVNSASYGVTVKSNAYAYLSVPDALAGSNVTLNSFYANWSGVSGVTNYLLDVSVMSNFTSCVAGYANLSVGNVATFWVHGLNVGTTYFYRVRCQQNGVISDNSSTISVQTMNGGMSVGDGPTEGGNTITITGMGLGNASDITNVTICGVMAVIQSQTADSVTVVIGVGGGGTGDIKVYSVSRGVTTFMNGYTYNPRGAIFAPFMGWSIMSNLPAARINLSAASVNGKIYAIGGDDGNNYRSTVYVYDPSQPAQGWLSASNLPAARIGLGVASVNGKIYAIGGNDGNNYQSTVYVYDSAQPSLGWRSVSNLPVARVGLAAASVNGKIYAIGGVNATSPYYYSTVYVYDPSQPAQGWLSVSNLPAARAGLVAASVNGKIYAIGGVNGTSPYYSTVYVYDPSQPAQGWLSVSNLPAARCNLAVASMNGKIFAIGGYDGTNYQIHSIFLRPRTTFTGLVEHEQSTGGA